MFSCPNNDIHSVYLDNELPEIYREKYENHIKNCTGCAAKLESMKKTRTFFYTDSNNIFLNKTYLDQSFERLNIKMRYMNTKKNISFYRNSLKIKIGIAAVFFIIFNFSLTILQNKKTSSSEISLVMRPKHQAILNKNIIINGNIDGNLANTINSCYVFSGLSDVDVFRPDFENPNIISINITVPELDKKISGINEIKLPQINGIGNFK